MKADNPSALEPETGRLKDLLGELLTLRQEVVCRAQQRLEKYRHCYPEGCFTPGARNLAHYLALRQFDLRHLQVRLAQAGISSLGRAEAYVLTTLDSVINLLNQACGRNAGDGSTSHGFLRAPQLLEQRTLELFGPFFGQCRVHVMVTLPSHAARDYTLIRDLLDKGMTCARINCAHDNRSLWQAMIGNVRRAESETGRSCRVLVDLAGHKIRTGMIASGPAVRHLKVKRDVYGRVVKPGFANLGASSSHYDAIPVPEGLLEKLRAGDRLEFADCRGKERSFRAEEPNADGGWRVSHDRSIFLEAGTEVMHRRPGKNGKSKDLGRYRVAQFQGRPLEIRLFKGDLLLLTEANASGRPAEHDADGTLLHPARIACTLKGIAEELQPGQSVWIDDGKLGCRVESIEEAGALLRVTQARDGGVRLLADRGINFPETRLDLPPLSEKDLEDLDFACRSADLIGFSFVESLSDMEVLMAELKTRQAAEIPIVAKIETNRALRNLPDIILGTIGRHSLGVMIARGDLAVELGSARLAEVQEELLWLCEAAHVPVIWATQVLESIAKKGVRSRPEFTDAAMGVRAECVMLNKGPYILDAVEALISVLVRMQGHQRKKFSRLRALHW